LVAMGFGIVTTSVPHIPAAPRLTFTKESQLFIMKLLRRFFDR